MSGSRTTAPRTTAPRNSGPRTTGSSTTVPEHVMPSATWGAPADFQTFLSPHRPSTAGPVCTVAQGRPHCECECPEHVMPSATWGAPADFQTFLPPHRTQEIVESKCNGTIGNVLLLGLAILMLIIGDHYNKEDLCRLDAPYCLLVLGGLTLGLSVGGIFYLLFICGCACTAPSSAVCCAATGFWGMILAMLVQFAVLIWATVRVFGSYSEWNHANTASETYCDQIPFSFAMGALIANWILLLVRGIPSSMKHVHSDYVAL